MTIKTRYICALAIPAVALASCSGDDASAAASVLVDGSSTVYPITEAVAEEFLGAQPRVRVTVGVSGTGGGFKKFLLGETDINDASRPIKQKELDAAAEAKIDFIELPVAYDGIAVVVNKKNDFLTSLTVDQLHQMWKDGGSVTKWSDLNPAWPAERIKLYGPGADSGTYDYFKEVVIGKKNAPRDDFTASEDDNVLVTGVSGDPNGLGFFGFAYWIENKERLKLVPIDGGGGPVEPSVATINDGSYKPLSRPLLLYVRKDSLQNQAVADFMNFYLDNVDQLAAEVGYVALPKEIAALTRQRLEKQLTGTMFAEHSEMPLLDLVRSKTQ